MDNAEKSEIIDRLLTILYADNIGTLPMLLDNRELVGHIETFKYQIIEADLIKFNLVRVLIPPGTNQTLNGFGEYAISPLGREMVMRKQSASELYKPSEKEQLELELAKSNLEANELNRLISKKNERNDKRNQITTWLNIALGIINIALLIWQILKDG